ncbi:MAG: PP2C family protein-serine/threonine phosphatase [Acidimicrobiales bacterium]
MGEGSLGRRRLHRLSIGVLVVGAAAVGGLTWVTAWSHGRNEQRLLDQRVREAAAVLVTSLPRVQTPLAAGAELAEATNGDATAFRRFATPLVQQGAPFVSVSLWQLNATDPRPLATIGQPSMLAARSADTIRAVLNRSTVTTSLGIVDLLDADQPRLGYAFASNQAAPSFVAYAEAALPPDRTGVVQQGSTFAGLDYALYLGPDETSSELLIASIRDLPITGRRSVQSVDFGDSKLTLAMRPREELGGPVLDALPWIIAAVGTVLTLAATLVTERLAVGRRHARRLANENQKLFESQRDIAQSLQRSLLPSRLPDIPGLEIAARYEPGVEGVEVGGDWYEVIALTEDRVMVVVGDVSGRGLEASAAMAALRFASRGFALEGHEPAAILARLRNLVDVERDGHFATILIALISISERKITFANAGHPRPVLRDDRGTRIIETVAGAPVGVASAKPYASFTCDVGNGATLVAFTDGLFERRGEMVDVGMERVRAAIATENRSLDEVLSKLMRDVATRADDDTAIVGIRWQQ